jgi:hypothetical protein
MSRGVVDEEARAILIKAGVEAAKRGLRIVSVTTYGLPGEVRSFRYGYEPLAKARRGKPAAPAEPEAPQRPRISRGVAPARAPAQGSLL